MKNKILATLAVSAFLVATGCSHKKDEKKSDAQETASLSSEVTTGGVKQLTADWPEASRSAIDEMTKQYGLPDAATEDMVVWNSSEPFKRTVVMRESVNHMFPTQHQDVLVQTIDYRVPLDKVLPLTKFNGSLIIDRTKGELSSRNERQEMNILALNIADKIVRGEFTEEQARREYRKQFDALEAGRSDKMLTELSFKTSGNTGDPDTMMQSQEPRRSSSSSRTTERSSEMSNDSGSSSDSERINETEEIIEE